MLQLAYFVNALHACGSFPYFHTLYLSTKNLKKPYKNHRPSYYCINIKIEKSLVCYVSLQLLEDLHWFPVRQRIEYRVISLVRRCQLGLAPAYLMDRCQLIS